MPEACSTGQNEKSFYWKILQKNYHCKAWKMVRSKSYKLLFANIPAALGSDYHIFRILIGSLDN